MELIRFGSAARLTSSSTANLSPEEHILLGNEVKDSPWVSLATSTEGFVFWCLNTLCAKGDISFSNWLAAKTAKDQLLWVIDRSKCNGEWYHPASSNNPVVKKRGKESREVLYHGTIPMDAVQDKGKLTLTNSLVRTFGNEGEDIGLRVTWLADSYEEPVLIKHQGVLQRVKQLKQRKLW